MFDVEIEVVSYVEFSVECEECGAKLKANYVEYAGGKYLSVEPCEDCLEAARKEGYEEAENDLG